MAFLFHPHTVISDLILVEPQVFPDGRGWFAEIYKRSEFVSAGIDVSFSQVSQSKSMASGTVRGLHFQRIPHAQGKLVRCIRGKAFDVAVDLRWGSPTYGKHGAVELSEENKKLFWIPAGFAHGFCAIEEGTEIEYFMTGEYSPQNEGILLWNDPKLAIPWPATASVLSAKDASGEPLEKLDHNFTWIK